MIRVPKTSQGSQGIFQGEGNQKKEMYSRLIEQEMQIFVQQNATYWVLRAERRLKFWSVGQGQEGGPWRGREGSGGAGGGLSHHRSLASFWELQKTFKGFR